jgi:hypothetical protein
MNSCSGRRPSLPGSPTDRLRRRRESTGPGSTRSARLAAGPHGGRRHPGGAVLPGRQLLPDRCRDRTGRPARRCRLALHQQSDQHPGPRGRGGPRRRRGGRRGQPGVLQWPGRDVPGRRAGGSRLLRGGRPARPGRRHVRRRVRQRRARPHVREYLLVGISGSRWPARRRPAGRPGPRPRRTARPAGRTRS